MRVSVVSAVFGLIASLGVAVSTAAGAAQGPDPRATALDFSHLCPAMSSTQGLPLCTRFYGGKPWIHLPPDPDATHVLGGIDMNGRFRAADGSTYPIKESVNPFFSWADADSHWNNTVYLATLTNGTVTAMERKALITEPAFLNKVLAGKVWEGRVTTWRNGLWDRDHTLRVRLEFADATAQRWMPARITNTYVRRVASNGTCLPAIARARHTPIFDGRTNKLDMSRDAGMHEPGDAVLVLTWSGDQSSGQSMADPKFMGLVPQAMGVQALSMTRMEFGNHADTRIDGPAFLNMHVVRDGGERC